MKTETTFALTPQEEARLRRLFIAAGKETKVKPKSVNGQRTGGEVKP